MYPIDDPKFCKRVKSLAWRYYRSYPYQFEILSMELDDIYQHLLIKVWKSKQLNHEYLINELVCDMYDLLRKSSAKKRLHKSIDIDNSFNDDFIKETYDESMERLVYHNKARYV